MWYKGWWEWKEDVYREVEKRRWRDIEVDEKEKKVMGVGEGVNGDRYKYLLGEGG